MKGDMTVAEAGRKGGERVKATYGVEFYSRIGKKGGKANAAKGTGWFKTIGQRGGQRTKQTYGVEFYSAIGRKGGGKLRDTRGREYFAAIGKMGKKRREGQHAGDNGTVE